jgi:transcriptional regulator with XRE-family HTH domain
VLKKEPDITAFGPEVRRRRQALGLTIERLAELAGMSPNQLGSIERGEVNPLLTTIIALASALGISVRALLGEEEKKLSSDALHVAVSYDSEEREPMDALVVLLRAARRPRE